MTTRGRIPRNFNPNIQNIPGTPAHDMEMAECRVARVKALSTELQKILQELADKFGCTKQEMAKLIQRRLERRKKEQPWPTTTQAAPATTVAPAKDSPTAASSAVPGVHRVKAPTSR